MGFAAFTFFVIFLLIASGGLLLFYRAAMLQRISSVVTPRARQAGGLYGSSQRRVSVGAMVARFERIMPKSQAEVSVAQQRLIRAGYRNDSAVKCFVWREGAGSHLSCVCWSSLVASQSSIPSLSVP